MVVETIGKTVYKKMVQVCMAFEDIAASAASRSSGLDRKMRCRRTNHAAMITLTKTIGMTVVATSLVRKNAKQQRKTKQDYIDASNKENQTKAHGGLEMHLS